MFQIIDEMEVLVASCPVSQGILCETDVIGQSVEGRDIKVLRVSLVFKVKTTSSV